MFRANQLGLFVALTDGAIPSLSLSLQHGCTSVGRWCAFGLPFNTNGGPPVKAMGMFADCGSPVGNLTCCCRCLSPTFGAGSQCGYPSFCPTFVLCLAFVQHTSNICLCFVLVKHLSNICPKNPTFVLSKSNLCPHCATYVLFLSSEFAKNDQKNGRTKFRH